MTAPSPTLTAPCGLFGQLRTAAADIKLAHSVFALPFAVLAVFLARLEAESAGVTAAKLGLVVVCMVLARTWAMLFNRLADARIDAANPRTQRRAFASKRLSMKRGWVIALCTGGVFVAAAALFWPLFDNPWPAYLAVPTLVWIAFYSLTKRFTALCHIFLGGALAASPIAAAIAVNPEALSTTPALWWIALMVLLWVSGFDVIYALQDMDFDREHELRSIPARFGWRGAAWISRVLHVGAMGALVLAWRAEPRLGVIYLGATVLVGALLVAEHVILARRGKAGLDMAFFTVNGVVSILLGLAATIDTLL